jgi:hypothetical protein
MKINDYTERSFIFIFKRDFETDYESSFLIVSRGHRMISGKKLNRAKYSSKKSIRRYIFLFYA